MESFGELAGLLRNDQKSVIYVAKKGIDLYFTDTNSEELSEFWKNVHEKAVCLGTNLKELYRNILNYLDNKIVELNQKPKDINNLLIAMGENLPEEDQQTLNSHFDAEIIYHSDGKGGVGDKTSLGLSGNKIVSLEDTEEVDAPTCGEVLEKQGYKKK